MMNADFENWEPNLEAALLTMIATRVGPAFDAQDVREAVGTDSASVRGPFISDRSRSVSSAAASAINRLSEPGGVPLPSGMVVHLRVGWHIAARAQLKALMEQLSNNFTGSVQIVAGASVDPEIGSDVQVTLWARCAQCS